MRGVPTERQAVLAARQLHYHRARLRWIEDRVEENQALLLSYLTRLGTGATVLPGGYLVSGEHASPDVDVAVERLAPKNPYEQLVLRVGGGETARARPRGSPAGEEPRKATAEGGLHQPCDRKKVGPTLSGSAADASMASSTSEDWTR